MNLTVNQKKIITKFNEEYFRPTLGETRISLVEFMDKSQADKMLFIKAWAQGKQEKMIQTDINLVAQRSRVTAEKLILDNGINDF